MKLIIDVEKDYYEIIKYNVEQGQKYKPWEIIANAIPYEERPQGEWKHIVEEDNDVECPFCGFQEDGVYYNFCPQCGARMKGGAE